MLYRAYVPGAKLYFAARVHVVRPSPAHGWSPDATQRWYDASERTIEASAGMKFEIIGELRSVETIARGREIRILPLLRKRWGAGRWRKMKGVAQVRILRTGHIREAEIHWYEAHGIGKRDFKIKKLL